MHSSVLVNVTASSASILNSLFTDANSDMALKYKAFLTQPTLAAPTNPFDVLFSKLNQKPTKAS